jgi:predicted nucleic acid-binding Zn ribbon protein
VLVLSEWLNRILGRESREGKPPSDVGNVVEGVTPHSHCERCGKAIEIGKRYCSDICKRGERKGSGSMLFWMILLLILMMLLWSR